MKVITKLTDNGFKAVCDECDVKPGDIFVPSPDVPFFGIANNFVKKGEIGSYSTSGVYMFQKPLWWYDEIGRPIYYRRSSSTTGQIVTSQIDSFFGTQLTGGVLDYVGASLIAAGKQIQIGWQVDGPQPNVLCVYLCQYNKFTPFYDAYMTTNR